MARPSQVPMSVSIINLFLIHQNWHPKWRVLLAFLQAPHPLASTDPPNLHRSNRLQRSAVRAHPPPGRLAEGVDDLWPKPFGKPRSRDLTVMGSKAEPATALKSAAERRSSPAPPRRQFGHLCEFPSLMPKCGRSHHHLKGRHVQQGVLTATGLLGFGHVSIYGSFV
jgi:hypothetical protein